jgi:hypothetical protein
MTMKLMTHGRKLLLAGVALTACLGFALNAQAQTCTVSNWTTPTNLSDADAGLQTGDGTNRRYGGPCGLQVDVDGTTRSVLTDTPQDESTYIVRFYTFLDNAGTGAVQLFNADDGAGGDVVQVWYNFPAQGDLTLRVLDAGGPTDMVQSGVSTGWHSVEFEWTAGASADIAYSVDGAADMVQTLDTSGQSVANAELGNLNGANTGGTVDFDDFDSRRIERPGRLMVGDANGDSTISGADNITLLIERNGGSYAAGQPDCNEDGEISGADNICLLILRLAP